MLLSSLCTGLCQVPVPRRLGRRRRAALGLFSFSFGVARKRMGVPMMAQFRVLGIRNVSHCIFHPIH